ncbi:MAG: ABC transporter permease [Acidobacteriota bacterium]
MSIYIDKSNNKIAISAARVLPPLPSQPIYTTKGKKGWFVNLKELWNYRELCYFFLWRDLKVRYRQTLLGVAWVIIQPLISMLIFTYFFGNLAKLSSDGIPYSIFYYCGLSLWIFFSNTVNNCSNSLNNDRNLITKVYFPRMLLPAATVLAGIVDLLIALGLLLLLAIYQGFMPTWRLLLLPLILLLAATLTYSLGLILAVLNLRYRDVRYALPFAIQLLFFITPIIFPLSIVPEKQRWVIIVLNPLSVCIEELRACTIGRSLNWQSLIVSSITTLISLLVCSYIFSRCEKTFAEKI